MVHFYNNTEYFLSKKKFQTLSKDSRVITTELPKQMGSPMPGTYKFSKAARAAIKTFLIGSILLLPYFSLLFYLVVCLMHQMQFPIYMPMLEVTMPANMMYVQTIFADIVTFDLIEVEKI